MFLCRSNTKELDKASMNLNQLISDTHELIVYLKLKFSKEKIYIMGHSFGATLALKTISKYPEDYAAYFGISQFVNTTEN